MRSNDNDAGRRFDVVVWGASGFTGRLVVEYLATSQSDPSLRWAVAGRDAEKLDRVLDEFCSAGERPAVLIADSHDRESLDRLVGSTRVVLSTVGPYARFGSDLVASCVRLGTHYCDLCGEVQWMRKMIDRYQTDAERSGARIVMSCGFDSIPSDLGVQFLQEHSLREHGKPCRDVTLLVRAMKGGASGGTFASMLNAIDEARQDRDVARVLTSPYSLNPEGHRDGPDVREQTGPRFHEDAGVWTGPFVMASVNTRVVRRSNALLDYPYGRDFRYREVTIAGKGLRGRLRAAVASIGLGLFMIAAATPWLRRLFVERLVPKPGDGPTADERRNGYFNLLILGKTTDGNATRVRVKGDRDPGYGSTSKMLAETAICLAKEDIGVGGGLWTPASALGARLRTRLVAHAGLSFELE